MQASAIAHPNVALIKYWGKQDVVENIPAVGSLSLTLAGLETRTTVSFDSSLESDQVTINGEIDRRASAQAQQCLDLLRRQTDCDLSARIESTNNFPTAAGLASSASGYAALVKAASAALALDLDTAELADIARHGSGSAARSFYPGIVALQCREQESRVVIECESVASPTDWPLVVVVAITSTQMKATGSTEGMERSRLTSPYYSAWVDTHANDLEAGLRCVANRDFFQLADLSEHSCLKMHAVAQSSIPPLLYWSGATVDVMRRIQELRADKVPVFFTVDAGPQVKAVCLPECVEEVSHELAAMPGVIDVLVAPLGLGARVVA
jgi:diphosphomevalonate decarboxylase